jgi:hypothetical protein
MKQIAVIAFIFLFSLHCLSQSEFQNKSNSFKPIGPNTVNPSPTPAAPSVFELHTKPEPYTSKFIEEKNKIQFTNTNDFKNPGDIYKEKLNKKSGEDDSKMFRSNQFLGDFKIKSQFVNISYRDFGEVDGDLIRVLVNGKEIVSQVYLEGNFKGFKLDLQSGFNKIDFEALNQGYSGPNTAQFVVYDDKGILVSSNQWNLATGFKATIIVVKE